MKHIGIIACSAEGAALCYTTIVNEAGITHILIQDPILPVHHRYLQYLYKLLKI